MKSLLPWIFNSNRSKRTRYICFSLFSLGFVSRLLLWKLYSRFPSNTQFTYLICHFIPLVGSVSLVIHVSNLHPSSSNENSPVPPSSLVPHTTVTSPPLPVSLRSSTSRINLFNWQNRSWRLNPVTTPPKLSSSEIQVHHYDVRPQFNFTETSGS